MVFPRIISLSTLYLLGFFTCVGLLAAAYYFEYVMFLDPCPLCIVQRLVTLGIGVGCLMAFLLRSYSTGQLISLGFIALVSAFGIWVADHHVWIQNLPADEVPACGPDLAYMVDTLPLAELISTVLRGSGSCADISWSFLGLSMPEWMRIWFAGFTGVAVACFFFLARKKN